MIGLVAPAWILTGLVGALCASFVAVIAPPRFAQFPGMLVAAIIGAGLGGILAGVVGINVAAMGDVHTTGDVIGALVAVAIVRRRAA